MDPAPDRPADGAIKVEHVDGRLAGATGKQIYWQGWLPEHGARGLVVVVHGGLEHSGRYDHVGTALARAGFAAYAPDLRGHGRSGGRPGQIERMSLLVDDVAQTVAVAAQRHPDTPTFVLGHSLGALVALEYTLDRHPDLAGLVISGVGLDVSAIPAAQARVAAVLSRMAPNLPLVAFDGGQVSRDPAVVHGYRTDPLVFHGRVPARTPGELLAGARRLRSRLPEVDVPLLVLHGGADTVAAPAGARLLHEQARSNDKTLRVHDGLFHEIFNEPEQDDVIAGVVSWMTERTQQR